MPNLEVELATFRLLLTLYQYMSYITAEANSQTWTKVPIVIEFLDMLLLLFIKLLNYKQKERTDVKAYEPCHCFVVL